MRNILSRNFINIPGWKTDRKIVVIQSDDWGSIRTAESTFNDLLEEGYPLDQCVYNSKDALETNSDLEYLMEVLSSVKDMNGNPAIFTINNIVANPDFDKIKEADFRKYFYEPFVQTLERLPNRDNVMKLYHEGIEEKLFKPQFHGREHVHTHHWIKALQEGNVKLLKIFNRGMFTYYKGEGSNCKNEYLDAMATYNEKQFGAIEDKIKSGLDLFEDIWGFRSKTLIAPCYIWGRNIEIFFHKYGVRLIQSGRCQKEPVYNQDNYNIIRRYIGQNNSHGQVYSIRNVQFEPASNPGINWVDKALIEISTAFIWKKPAVISTHRVNFIGSINPKNRSRNLILLKELLQKIINKWPEVEFISSDHLADLILEK
ncbi:hypothetical protein G3570_16035 [Balneolaceae bacterium YR4-1]|uniref:Polysaccharide (De)acetylase n=1 Tax=Halalkalibaculum roseum TaxID=2709311 RepID=A0A6M1TD98_9BACT|nr:hypothetical protein [Halalkalibaculum roseum]NGP78153.1 hypothetical protein [Halalkalibaculum roseum]